MTQRAEFVIRYGMEAMDFRAVTGMLENVYWSRGIKEAEIIQGASGSTLVAGAFRNGNQIGYARVVSDKTRFAYILDVVVHEAYRKSGIGRALVNSLLAHEEMKSVYQWMLQTKDAHGVYRKLGFAVIANPECWMEIRNPRPLR
jgi:ribosomal protein S18 acetylase RimI-like enzyme